MEEVLDSLRLRIRHMFKWAKFEVVGFEDLSPLDQKALLRRTVAELVMLGFARGSIPYDGGSLQALVWVYKHVGGEEVCSYDGGSLQALVWVCKCVNVCVGRCAHMIGG